MDPVGMEATFPLLNGCFQILWPSFCYSDRLWCFLPQGLHTYCGHFPAAAPPPWCYHFPGQYLCTFQIPAKTREAVYTLPGRHPRVWRMPLFSPPLSWCGHMTWTGGWKVNRSDLYCLQEETLNEMHFFLLWLWKPDWDRDSQMVPEWTQGADFHKEKKYVLLNLEAWELLVTQQNLT